MILSTFSIIKAKNISLEVDLDLKSNALRLNTFDKKWQILPKHKSKNSTVVRLLYKINWKIDSYQISLFKKKELEMMVNDGFIQTWYAVDKSFDKLLRSEDIGKKIPQVDISGWLNYYDTKGVSIQKEFIYKKHKFFITTNLYKAKNMQNLIVYGKNSKYFKVSFDYYYSDKNYISKNKNHDNAYSGKGYGFDLAYLYKNQKYTFLASIQNIHTFIDWKSITLMHYDFDSNTIYKGSDGYNHKKPFGQGYYKYDINYKQKIPIQKKVIFEYKIKENIIIGDKLELYKQVNFNQIYTQFNYHNISYKVGTLYKDKVLLFGVKYKYFYIDISNNLNTNKKIISCFFKISR